MEPLALHPTVTHKGRLPTRHDGGRDVSSVRFAAAQLVKPDHPTAPSTPTHVPLARRAPRAANVAFGLLLVAAGAVYAVRGRSQWFFQDEWSFLAGRDATSVDGLFRPHSGHWVTAPVVVYRTLWAVVGAHRYEPYQAMAITSHLAVVLLVYLLLRRRLDISPWVAVAASSIVLFTGVGAENVVWGFQITFTGSVVSGLAALLLADHPHPRPRRRIAALACGLLSLMCSGVGLIMVAVLGLALLARRGLRPALAATVPLGVVYGIWNRLFASDSADPSTDAGLIGRFIRTGLSNVLHGVGPTTEAGWVLVALAVGGMALVIRDCPSSPSALRQRLAIPVSMATGALLFFALTGSTRVVAQGLVFATRGRYAYVAIVLLVPLLALAADAVVARWPIATVPVLMLLVVGVPANVAAIEVRESRVVPAGLVTAAATSPALADAPTELLPFDGPPGTREITAGWLQRSMADGRFPTDGTLPPDLEAEALARLTLETGAIWSGTASCHELPPGGEEVTITTSRPVAFVGRVRVFVKGEADGRSRPRTAGALVPRTIATIGAPVTVLVVPLPGVWAASLCR